MDRLSHYRQVIEQILRQHTQVAYAHGELALETVFDRDANRYLLMLLGRDQQRRVHGCLAHIDIIDGKIWIQRDGTETGLANELVAADVPKEDIVLGFRSPELRQHTEFAAS